MFSIVSKNSQSQCAAHWLGGSSIISEIFLNLGLFFSSRQAAAGLGWAGRPNLYKCEVNRPELNMLWRNLKTQFIIILTELIKEEENQM